MRESDLAPAITDYLQKHGYTVRSEVHSCDITAVKGDELVIIELKRAFSVDLLLQALDRQRLTESVYVAVPTESVGPRHSKKRRGIEALLGRLEMGLMLVLLPTIPDTPSVVEVVLHPVAGPRPRQKPKVRRAILKEIAERSDDYNVAGVAGRALLTAYREQAIFLACLLHCHGEQSPAALRTLGGSPKAQAILHRNVYQWFIQVRRGVYDLRPRVWENIAATWPVLAERCELRARAQVSGLRAQEGEEGNQVVR